VFIQRVSFSYVEEYFSESMRYYQWSFKDIRFLVSVIFTFET